MLASATRWLRHCSKGSAGPPPPPLGQLVERLGLVFDSIVFGTLDAGPVEISAHEQDDGSTNKPRVRAELNARATIEVPSAAAVVSAT